MSSKKPFQGKGTTLKTLLEKAHSVWGKENVQSLVDLTHSLHGVYQTFRTGEPSLIDLGGSTLQITSFIMDYYDETRDPSSPAWKYFTLHAGNVVIPHSIIKSYHEVIPKDRCEIKRFKGSKETSRVNVFTTKLGAELLWVDTDPEASPEVTVTTNIVCTNPAHIEDSVKEISEMTWAHYGSYIEVLNQKNVTTLYLAKKEKDPWDYKGEQGEELVKRWKAFFDKGVRRNVILQGPPGTGKSTLSRYAASKIGKKILFIPIDTLVTNSQAFADLTRHIQVLRPDIIIIDDLDRLSPEQCDRFLAFFEESEKSAPLLIASTNHIERLPAALRRPGRFDEIWKIDAPKDEVQATMIRYFADIEGVEITEEQVKTLTGICGNLGLPGSHIREILRRVAVMGWDEIHFNENDLSFTEGWSLEQPDTYEDEDYEDEYFYEDDFEDDEEIYEDLMEEAFAVNAMLKGSNRAKGNTRSYKKWKISTIDVNKGKVE